MSLVGEFDSDIIETFNELDDIVFNFTISYDSVGDFDPIAGVSEKTETTGSWRGIRDEFTEKDLDDFPVGKTAIKIIAISSEAPFIIDENVDYSILLFNKKYIVHSMKFDPANITCTLICIGI